MFRIRKILRLDYEKVTMFGGGRVEGILFQIRGTVEYILEGLGRGRIRGQSKESCK